MIIDGEQQPEEQPQSFEQFEAEAGKEPDDKPDENEPVNDQGDKGDEQPEDKKPEDEKSRSRDPASRIAHYRWQAGEAERQRDAALAELAALKGGKQPEPRQAPVAPDPNDDKYEFGQVDPQYDADKEQYYKELAEWTVEQKLAERNKQDEATAEQTALRGKLNEGMAAIETKGAEKYEDFEDVVREAAETRGEPLHPMIGIGLAVSPAGADLTYKLAKDDAAVEKLERLVMTNPVAAALAFGEMEGEFLSADHDDSDLDLRDPMDMARMNGRMKARLRGAGSKPTATVRPTNAPEPPKHQVRGTSGKFEVGADTTDFAAFEKKAKREAAG